MPTGTTWQRSWRDGGRRLPFLPAGDDVDHRVPGSAWSAQNGISRRATLCGNNTRYLIGGPPSPTRPTAQTLRTGTEITMDAAHFDRLAQSFAASGSRRALLRLLSALPLLSSLASLLHEERAAAQRRRRKLHKRHDRLHQQRKKKKKKCAKAGQTTSKKRKKKCCPGLVKDGSGRCAQPASDCIPGTCGPTSCGSVPDGCGGTLSCGGCVGNALCHAGVCQPCDVTCPSGIPTICGAELQAVLEAGGTVYVCPGRYQGNFVPDAAVRVIGAGEGVAATSNTILDANGAGRVLVINAGVGLVELERLRLTGGAAAFSAGIWHQGTTLRMTACTVSGNSTGPDGSGGGILTYPGTTLEMTRCTVRDNHATGDHASGGGLSTAGTTTLTDCLVEANRADLRGGGLFVENGTTTLAGTTQVRGNAAEFGGGVAVFFETSTLVIAETCRVTGNTADAGFGGGIYNVAGTVTLAGAAPSPIVVNNCLENCFGTVPKCSTEPPVSCPP